jgi:succinate dehydrogenase hydrophobic anchor subunit
LHKTPTPKSAMRKSSSANAFSIQSVSNEDMLSYVCVAVIGIFVVIAKPENTAVFFSHPLMKALLFIVVAAVVYADV